ncbi:unnamed protein product, partial [Phaeothamnion confervicola]
MRCGADAVLCTPLWVANHLRWVIWKLAGLERSHPMRYGGRVLRRSALLRQLRCRYEVEINQSAKSAIKAVLQGDAGAASFMVLCVSRIYSLPRP